MKQKNLSLELLKFLAVILVINSHCGPLYGRYSALATGGAIGDALFFFASGFTLFLGRFGKFDNWYKRRIKRIYPSVIAWAFVKSVTNISQPTLWRLAIGGGHWFISCIMLYYIVLYFVRKFFPNKPVIPFLACSVAIMVWYLFEDSSTVFMYGATHFKWLHYFLYMLAGAYIGNNVINLKSKPLTDGFMLVVSLLLFYGIQWMATRSVVVAHLQVITLIPLMGIVIYTYKLCSAQPVDKMMRSRLGLCLRFIAGLCLDAYIVQPIIINMMANAISFPLNLPITFIIIIGVAYLTRCLARIISQLFEKEDFDWKTVVRMVD